MVAVNGSVTVKNTVVAPKPLFQSEMALELHQAMAVDPSRVDGICIGRRDVRWLRASFGIGRPI